MIWNLIGEGKQKLLINWEGVASVFAVDFSVKDKVAVHINFIGGQWMKIQISKKQYDEIVDWLPQHYAQFGG